MRASSPLVLRNRSFGCDSPGLLHRVRDLCRSRLTVAATALLLLGGAGVGCGGDDTVGFAQPAPARGGSGGGGEGETGGRGGRDVGGSAIDASQADSHQTEDAEPDDASDARSDATTTESDVAVLDVPAAPDTPAADTVDPARYGGVAGTVWAPGNAPGMVPSGQEIPISGALVYLHLDRPTPIPQRAYCAACETPPSRAVFSGNDGSFVVDGYTAGTYWLVIEKGQFRLEQEITIAEATLTPLDASLTTLPSENDPEAGLTTPRIALAGGSYDHLEDILGKMGLGDVDSSGIYVPESSRGVIDVYDNGGDLSAVSVGSLTSLVQDLDRLMGYHIVFVPCSGDAHTSVLNDQAALRNLRDFVAAGGNLYVTDWSGEWADNVFPEQLRLRDGLGGFMGGGVDTPPTAYDRARDAWNTGEFGTADGDAYNSPNAQAVDPDLFAWLDGQQGPTAHSSTPSVFDANSFEVEGNWNAIEEVVTVEVGTDDRGEPVFDEPHVWVAGGSDSAPTPRLPLTVSYEPVGCGRVLYSTYHTTDDRHVGLAPQERVLLYLVMEIGTCRDPKR